MSLEDAAYYLEGQFQNVKGWCIPQLWNLIQPLHEYQQTIGIKGPIAEIGVFHGKFFIGLALLKKDEGIHTAFDVFELQQFNLDGAGKGNLNTFRGNLATAGISDSETDLRQVDSMTMTQDDIARVRAERGMFSMFSVDGCHMAEHTINDFRLAMELTQPGGVIFVDDYLNPDWPGVGEGMARLFLNDCPRFVPIAYTCNKLVTCHISYAQDMRNYLAGFMKEHFPKSQTKIVQRFGYDCLNVRPDMLGPALKTRAAT